MNQEKNVIYLNLCMVTLIIQAVIKRSIFYFYCKQSLKISNKKWASWYFTVDEKKQDKI